MIKFKDLYMSLEVEGPVQRPHSGSFCGSGGPPSEGQPQAGPIIFDLPHCVQNQPATASGFICYTMLNSALCEVQGGNNAPSIPVLDFLRIGLKKAMEEPNNLGDIGELDALEQKLSAAIEQVRALRTQIRSGRRNVESKDE